jgi:hypothetical protein
LSYSIAQAGALAVVWKLNDPKDATIGCRRRKSAWQKKARLIGMALCVVFDAHAQVDSLSTGVLQF